MNAQNATCPPDPMLADFGLGKLDEASSDTISQHLDTCADCRLRVASFSGDSFVGRLREACPGGGPKDRERTYVPGESLAGAASSTDGSPAKEDGLPRPSRTSGDDVRRDGLGSPSSASAPPELANHPDYELLKELGRGGMGVVYLARNRMMDRLEVLKVVNKALLDRPEALERFQQEIRSAARLLHPNIVAAHSVLRPGDLLVFAMEYVRGQDLSQVVKARGQLPVAHAAFYAHQVALGLQHAHEKGMVHRDIKPNNLMLAVEGKKHVVKILDFGLSKATSEKGAEAGLTKSGQILGTPDYVAPEQTLNAQKADIRADIYSLGCTLYHLLSGGPPFQESSLYGILEAHQKRDARPLNLVRPDVPVELAAVVAKMMAKEPAKRYQTPAEVARALVSFFKPGQSAVTADLPPRAEAERSHAVADASRAIENLAATPAAPPSPAVVSVPPYRPIPVATPLPAPQSAAVARPDGDIGISIHPRSRVKAWRGGWSTLPPWQQRVAVAGVSAILLLLAGIVLFVETEQGTVRIEINDPAIEVVVDGKGATIKGVTNQGAQPEEIVLEPGRHGLRIKYGKLDFETDKFILNRADTVTLKVELLAGKVRVVQGDTVLGEQLLPAVAPPPAIAPFDVKQAVAHQETWAKHLGTNVEIENSIGMKLRLIPPGEFTMGSPQDEIDKLVKTTPGEFWLQNLRSEAPRHGVKLTQAFYLGSCEVTQAQYQEVMGGNPSHFSVTGPGANKVKDLDTGQNPVEMASWFDAIDFCNKLSENEQRSPYYARNGDAVKVAGGSGYRLPTEAEWEYACRAGTTTRWYFGDNETDLTQAAWVKSNSGDRTHQAGKLRENPFGLYDLYGNVWEWCSDSHGTYVVGAVSDPTESVAGSFRVLRGGGFVAAPWLTRSAYRDRNFPLNKTNFFGFRVARTVDVKGEIAPPAVNDGSGPTANETAPTGESVTPPSAAIAPFDAKQAVTHQEAWAKHLGTKVEIENSLGMKLRLIPPGEFKMGSPPSEADRRDDELQHRVRITKPSFLGVCEVTQREYQNVMGNNSSHYSPGGAGKDQARGLDSHQFPVENVSWDDAVEFCRKLSALAAEQTAGHVYRLPTEAEWEYACRAGTTTPFHVGDKLNGQQANYDGQHPFATNGGGPFLGRPTEVGSYAPNPFGLRDMHGNVAEWCFDWHAAYGDPVGGAVDPVGAGTGSTRVIRGGGWVNGAAYCRTASRESPQPTVRLHHLGFRVAQVPSGQASDAASVGRAGPKETPASPPPAGAASVGAPEVAIVPFDAKQARADQDAWAKRLGTEVEIENSLGMKLRLIPPGEFMMGSPQAEIDALVQSAAEPYWQDLFPREGPRHRVKLTQAFYLGSCEVTQAQYKEVMGVNPSHFSVTGPGKDAVKGLDTGQHPVEMASWFDAVDFCNKLSEREQRSPYYVRQGEGVKVLGGTGYRLPTEAEWENACRAGTTTRWSFGDNERDLAQHAWIGANSNGRTQRVGELPANPFGLYDLYGNVWEWCWDWHGDYGKSVDGAVDPVGAKTGSNRVSRGGAWGDDSTTCRSASRVRCEPSYLEGIFGFRVARSSVQVSKQVSQGGRQ